MFEEMRTLREICEKAKRDRVCGKDRRQQHQIQPINDGIKEKWNAKYDQISRKEGIKIIGIPRDKFPTRSICSRSIFII